MAVTISGDGSIAGVPSGLNSRVVQGVKTDTFSTTSTSFVDTGLSVTITPTSASSKILVSYSLNTGIDSGNHVMVRVVRNGTPIGVGDTRGSRQRISSAFYITNGGPAGALHPNLVNDILDTPGTTSAVTYKVQMLVSGGTGFVNRRSDDTDSSSYATASSTITAVELFDASTPAAVQGLTLIASQSFSAASLSIDNCFTSTYDNYRILIDAQGSTSSMVLGFRLRASGTDSTASYNFARSDMSSGISGTSGSSASSADLGVISSVTPVPITWDLFSPAMARFTTFTTLSYRPENLTNVTSGRHAVSSAFDGVTVYVNGSGTASGKIRIYGYAN